MILCFWLRFLGKPWFVLEWMSLIAFLTRLKLSLDIKNSSTLSQFKKYLLFIVLIVLNYLQITRLRAENSRYCTLVYGQAASLCQLNYSQNINFNRLCVFVLRVKQLDIVMDCPLAISQHWTWVIKWHQQTLSSLLENNTFWK